MNCLGLTKSIKEGAGFDFSGAGFAKLIVIGIFEVGLVGSPTITNSQQVEISASLER